MPNIIFERKSVRQYLKDDLSDEVLDCILHAGMSAPSAGNARPWSFILVKDKSTHEKIMQIHRASSMLKNAPVAVIVCADLDAEKYKGYWPQDCAAVVTNMLLAATSKAIGSVWCGVYPIEERVSKFKELFKLPDNIIAFALVVFGKEDGNAPVKQRWQPEKIKYEVWSESR